MNVRLLKATQSDSASHSERFEGELLGSLAAQLGCEVFEVIYAVGPRGGSREGPFREGEGPPCFGHFHSWLFDALWTFA